MRMMWRLVCSVNGRGSRSRRIPVSSCNNWLPLRRLHGWQQATRFSQVLRPPRERGTTWSSVNSADVSTTPQYWQELRSRSRMFLRESARVWCGMRRYSSRRMTDGSAMRIRAACRTWPCSSSVRATPFSTSTSARRVPQMLIGSYDAFSTSTGVCIAGDVALFRMARRGPAKHCGIVAAGNGALTLIHARHNRRVREEPLTPSWRRKLAFAFRLHGIGSRELEERP